MLLGRAQRQSQRVHTARLHRAKFGGERGMNRARSRHAVYAAERLAHQQDTVVGLANIPLAGTPSRTYMTGVVRAVVRHAQHLGRERGGQSRR